MGITIGLIWGAFTNGILYTALPIRYVAHDDQETKENFHPDLCCWRHDRLEDRYGLSSQEVGFSSLAIAGPNIVFAPLAVSAFRLSVTKARPDTMIHT